MREKNWGKSFKNRGWIISWKIQKNVKISSKNGVRMILEKYGLKKGKVRKLRKALIIFENDNFYI